MKKSTINWLWAGGILVGAGMIIAGTSYAIAHGRLGVSYQNDGYAYVYDNEESNSSTSGKMVEMDAFSDIDINVSFADLYFVESDHYAVEYKNMPSIGRMTKLEVRNGVLNVNYSYKSTWGRNWFTTDRFASNTPLHTEIIVYYPQGTEFQNVAVKADFSECNLKNLKANSLNLKTNYTESDLGGMMVQGQTTVKGDFSDISASSFSSGYYSAKLNYGSLSMQSVDLNGADISSDFSDIKIQGDLKGENRISANFGDIVLTLQEPIENYQIDAKVNLGSLQLGEREIEKKYQMEGGPHRLEIDIDMANVRVGFATTLNDMPASRDDDGDWDDDRDEDFAPEAIEEPDDANFSGGGSAV